MCVCVGVCASVALDVRRRPIAPCRCLYAWNSALTSMIYESGKSTWCSVLHSRPFRNCASCSKRVSDTHTHTHPHTASPTCRIASVRFSVAPAHLAACLSLEVRCSRFNVLICDSLWGTCIHRTHSCSERYAASCCRAEQPESLLTDCMMLAQTCCLPGGVIKSCQRECGLVILLAKH